MDKPPPPGPIPESKILELPLSTEWQEWLGIASGTHLCEIAALSPAEAKGFLNSLWSTITDPNVAELRATLTTYDLEGIWCREGQEDLAIVLRKNMGEMFREKVLRLFIDPPLPSPPHLPSILQGPCAAEFYRFFPQLSCRDPTYEAGFHSPPKLYRFHQYGYYNDPQYLEEDPETRLHWKDSWIIYSEADGTSILLREDGEMCSFSMPEMEFAHLFYGYEQLMRRIAQTLLVDDNLSFYRGLLSDPEPK